MRETAHDGRAGSPQKARFIAERACSSVTVVVAPTRLKETSDF
jgi:hypothetical protein